jgi:hypothetical protein
LQPWLEHNSKSCTRAELCEELTTIWKTKQTHTHTKASLKNDVCSWWEP